MSEQAIWYRNRHTGEKATEWELERKFEELLDETCNEVKILGLSYAAGWALKRLDPIAFNEAHLNHLDSESEWVEIGSDDDEEDDEEDE